LIGGKGDNIDLNNFDQAEVEMGIQEEMEHTTDELVAQEIVADHLSEDKNYYSNMKMTAMESLWKEVRGLKESAPSNIVKFAKERGFISLVNKIDKWIIKAGHRNGITGGTAVGKYYSTLILDVSHQDSQIRVDMDDGSIEAFGEDVNNYNDFKKAYDKYFNNSEALKPGKYKTKGGEDIEVHSVDGNKATISGNDSKDKEIDLDALNNIIQESFKVGDKVIVTNGKDKGSRLTVTALEDKKGNIKVEDKNGEYTWTSSKLKKESASIENEVSDKGDVEDSEIILEESLSEDLTTSNGDGAIGIKLRGRDSEIEEDDYNEMEEVWNEVINK